MANPELFKSLKDLLLPYVDKGFTVVSDDETNFILSSVRPLVIEGRKFDQIYLAGVRNGKTSTVLHYFPIYGNPKMALDPALLKLLKGKTCFHFKKLDDTLSKAVSEALEMGYQAYKRNDWV